LASGRLNEFEIKQQLSFHFPSRVSYTTLRNAAYINLFINTVM